VQYMDDSDGGMGDVMYRLQELHLKSCEKAKQNPAKLAALRAQDHPLDAVEVYMKYVHPTIEQTNNKAYEEAVHLSKKIQSLMLRQRKDEAFTAYVDELRTRYKAKRNFIKLLDKIQQGTLASVPCIIIYLSTRMSMASPWAWPEQMPQTPRFCGNP